MPASAVSPNLDPPSILRLMGAAPSRNELLNPAAMAGNLWTNRALIHQFIRREFLARNRGSALGFLWTILHPLLMLAVYTFVFAIVWNARWGGENESKGLFAVSVFCGLIVWEVFSGGVGPAAGLVVSNTNLVKKVIFPIEILPLAGIGTAVVVSGISLVILLGAAFFINGTVSTTLWAFPAVLVPLVALTCGVSWLVASLGVFLRDLKQLVSGILLPVFFFTSPIFYPAERVPESFRWIISYNPMAHIIEGARRTLLFSKQPDWLSLGVVTLFSLIVMQLGYAFFMKSKRSFADVL